MRLTLLQCYPHLSMIQFELRPEIESRLAAEAQARGLALGRYIETIVAGRPVARTPSKSSAEAVARILELREGTDMGGLKIKDLINEGRKY